MVVCQSPIGSCCSGARVEMPKAALGMMILDEMRPSLLPKEVWLGNSRCANCYRQYGRVNRLKKQKKAKQVQKRTYLAQIGHREVAGTLVSASVGSWGSNLEGSNPGCFPAAQETGS